MRHIKNIFKLIFLIFKYKKGSTIKHVTILQTNKLHNMLGIENLKKAAFVFISLGKTVETTQVDGFQVTDLLSFLSTFVLVPELAANKNTIVDEFLDLDAAEKSELVNYVNATFDLTNDNTEEVIEKAFEAALSVFLLVDAIRK